MGQLNCNKASLLLILSVIILNFLKILSSIIWYYFPIYVIFTDFVTVIANPHAILANLSNI